MTGKIAQQAILQHRDALCKLALDMWAHPEPGFLEVQAAKWTADLLQQAGFSVELGCCGVPTAVRAVWGSGHPVVGFLGEFDALPGMSQRATTMEEPLEAGAYGHACGHNLIAAGHAAAAIGMKAELAAKNNSGTVVYYGCPAEELGAGKAMMARGGAFSELDVALAFHPSWFTYAFYGGKAGSNGVKFHFTGRASHAGSSPHNGRNALSAVELCNIGANYLREYLPPGSKLYYTIAEVGGDKPGIIPAYACAHFSYKAPDPDSVSEVFERLCAVAEGAAMMTGTQLRVERLGGCSALINNRVLVELLDAGLRAVEQEPHTAEEIAFAEALNQTNARLWKIKARETADPTAQLQRGVLPIRSFDTNGSTDVGDVSQIVPTAFCKVACYNIAANSHTWQATACTGGSLGLKGMLFAGAGLAAAGVMLVEQPDLLQAAQKEFATGMGGNSYVNPLPADYKLPELQ